MVRLLDGLFDELGLEIIDTGETIDFRSRLDPNATDFNLRVFAYQIDRLIEHARTSYNDPLARFALVREFLTALPHHVQGLLNNSVVTNPAFRKLIKSKDLLHLHLVSPAPEEEPDSTYTLFFVNGRWSVANGLAGEPDRVFELTPNDSLDLLRHCHRASRAGLTEIPAFAKWYVDWRARVEVKAA